MKLREDKVAKLMQAVLLKIIPEHEVQAYKLVTKLLEWPLFPEAWKKIGQFTMDYYISIQRFIKK